MAAVCAARLNMTVIGFKVAVVVVRIRGKREYKETIMKQVILIPRK